MRPSNRRSTRRPGVAVVLAALVMPLAAVPAAAAGAGTGRTVSDAPPVGSRSLAAAGADSPVTITGHGWGHGRGMGQYGALGYAVNHGWDYRAILGHYYGNTTVGNIGSPTIDVELVSRSAGNNWTLVAGYDLRMNGTDVPGSGLDVVQVVRSGNQYRVLRGAGCEAPTWTEVGTFQNGVEFTVPTGSGYENLVRTCEPGNTMRAYRGSIVVKAYGSDASRLLVANRVDLDNYLLGVVPRESPDSWGSLGGGKGLQALKAQAVAARSYAYAGGNRASGAKTCDTTSCQVYGGAAEFAWNGSTYAMTKTLDGTNAVRAVSETSGEVRMLGGAVARTEFSSSTGGYTTGGTFPAVPDAGDSVAQNPNHTWTVQMTMSGLASKLGVAGPLRDFRVTARNGLGDWGGRVTQIQYTDANGRTYTLGNPANPVNSGETIRTRLGLKSDWFLVSGSTYAQASAVVRALYEDLLGRGVDSRGLATWTTKLIAGTSQSQLVNELTASDEYIKIRVAQAYRQVLGREPEARGAADWLERIRSGRVAVDEVQRTFYDSQEFYNKTGGTPEGYVRRLYETMLGRSPAASELAVWVPRMSSWGQTRVVDGIWFSMEAARRRAGTYYQTFLKRNPDAAGVDTWARVLLERGEGAVRQGIAGSDEYRQRALNRFPA